MIVKYATTIVYVGTDFSPQLLENSSSHSNSYNNLIFLEKITNELNRKGIVDFPEDKYGITDIHQNYEKCECGGLFIKNNRKMKSKVEDFENFPSLTED